LAEGTSLIRDVEAVSATSALAALAKLAADVHTNGFSVAGVAVVAADRALPPELERILSSHALLHSAEGDLYEQALTEGAARAGLPVMRVTAGSIPINSSLETAGRTLGPPWQKDHKLAARAAMWLLMTAPP